MKLNTKDQKKIGIYLIRNLINGKVYIGKSKNIYYRLKDHITRLNTKNKNENLHLTNSWHKYGKENFAYVVLEYFEELDEKLLSEKELYYMQKYDSLNRNKGYNLRYDSSTGLVVSKETRKRMSESQIKRYLDPKEREKISKKSSEFWKNNPDKLAQMAKKVAKKIRKYKIGKFNYNSEELIEVFNTRKELEEKYPDFYIQAILGCCGGTKNSYKSFKWKYISIETGEIITNNIMI